MWKILIRFTWQTARGSRAREKKENFPLNLTQTKALRAIYNFNFAFKSILGTKVEANERGQSSTLSGVDNNYC